MTDTTNRTRVQAGVSAGGQFATEPKTEPDIALPAPRAVDREQVLAVRDDSFARAELLQKLPSGGEPALRHRTQLRTVAATVRAAYPSAVSFDIEESDQYGSTSGYVSAIRDPEGRDLMDGYGAEYGEDEYGEDTVDSMLYDVQETYPELGLPGVTFEGSYERGYVRTVNIDAALVPEPEPPTGADPSRAKALIEQYRAHHDHPDASLAQSARAALADLLAWANGEGVHVRDLLEDFDR
ncbi:hypothetical protein [Pseudactinotalea terrae]|uniref:hypothetical protein n=1 Tax=Pseudactinotalea terrae TaxID=1743262 RepID=UPI0012E1BA9A|nr:hypothetical protein [Pseudactinotalea terrae]